MNRIINMLIRQVMRNGMNHGIRSLSRGGKDFSDMSQEERQQAQSSNQQMQQTRRMANIARRFMR